MSGPAGAADSPAPLIGASEANAIDGQYIVVMKDQGKAGNGFRTQAKGDNASVRAKAEDAGGKVEFTYDTALNGFSAKLSDAALAEVRSDPAVDYVEVDGAVEAFGDQANPTWGLDRVDQRALPLSSSYHYDQTGAGVTAYIIDTGILSTHSQFSGRVASGFYSEGSSTTDENGHGTHVAGTVGGSTYGVAKNVTLVPVRVLDAAGSGTDSGVIAGVNWVTSHHTSGPAVANMSLGGGASTALDTAVNSSIADGVTYAVAAGNDNANASSYSPARVANAITVGATTSTDARASYSNYGSILDVFAPGSSITSAWHTSTSATNTISGTSMATPHVAGVAALYLAAHTSATPATVQSWITSNATADVVTSPGTGSPNRLLYSLEGGTTPDPEPTDPPTTGNLLTNPGFESGATGWTATSGVIDSSTGAPARTGSYKAWLNGYGSTRTETLSQTVTLPATAKTLSFYLRVTSSETTTSTAYDKLTVKIGSTTLATYSNLNKGSSYVLKSFSLAAYAGSTVTLTFTGTEDSSLATSFLIDDTSIA